MCLQQMLIVFNILTALCGQMVEFGMQFVAEHDKNTEVKTLTTDNFLA